MASVEIVEVGPRDGLQAIPAVVPTEEKLELIRGLIGAGVRRLEIGSFVSPRHVPQMADMRELVERLGPAPDGVRYIALVPNLKGTELAVAAGVREIAYVVSCTESHNQSNVRRPIADSVAEFREIAALAPVLRVGLSCSFDCPFEGRTPEAAVLGLAERLLAVRSDIELELADTTGMATPDHVRALARSVLERLPATWAFHGHDTAGFGVANVLAAWEAGIRVFDASIAGLGGCPFAPGATGNVATEDVVYAFERQGIDTGIDLSRLLEVAERAAGLPEATTGGHIRIMPRARVLASLEGRAAA